jgi:hypothetical protein
VKSARVLAGVGVLAILAAVGVVLLPRYLDNFEFQKDLEQIVKDPANLRRSPDIVRVKVVESAARRGLPVTQDQVRVAPANGKTRIEVRYFVRVDIPVYTVDLHFRPSAAGP